MSSTLTKEIIKPYLNTCFFETGIYEGDGLFAAQEAGFKELYGLELEESLCIKAHKRFPNATIMCGDSFQVFEYVIAKINKPTTFFLDAHVQFHHQPPFTTALHELEVLSRHPCVGIFTILVDDIRLFKDESWANTSLTDYVKYDDLISAAEKIPNKSISFIDNRLFENDIMVIQ